MIDIQVRIHDKYSVEFKIGYVVKGNSNVNDFMMNTWIFIPHNLDINPSTYSKNQFYRDVKSSVRLITPIYKLEEVANDESLPFMFLQGAFNELIAEQNKENLAEYEYQIKMFSSIVKSALRDDTEEIINSHEDNVSLIDGYVHDVEKIMKYYRFLGEGLKHAEIPQGTLNYFRFGDEFLSNRVEWNTYKLLEYLKRYGDAGNSSLRLKLLELIEQEIAYKKANNYQTIEKDSEDRNRNLVFRWGLLKKYIGSHLFLNARKKKDGVVQEQVYYSLAAGISMIFATSIAFSFQQKYGNFTMPLFVALVVSYMLKDRIKDLFRYYFAHRLGGKYFDNKTAISMKNIPIGWLKEGVDFISEDQVPEEVIGMRSRSDILQADNRDTQEKIMLYRKLVRIETKTLKDNNQYDISGINNIVRYNLSTFMQRMDSPEVPLYVSDENSGYTCICGEKIYYINFLIQFRYEDNIHYKRYRLIVSRDEIQGIDEMK